MWKRSKNAFAASSRLKCSIAFATADCCLLDRLFENASDVLAQYARDPLDTISFKSPTRLAKPTQDFWEISFRTSLVNEQN